MKTGTGLWECVNLDARAMALKNPRELRMQPRGLRDQVQAKNRCVHNGCNAGPGDASAEL